jgi:predicted nucleic acid-binding protein
LSKWSGVPTAPEGAAVRRAILDEMYQTLDILPFFEREADAYRSIIEALGFSRRLIVDRMIAATALANHLLLATLNPRDFRDVPGLQLEDWS